MYNDDVMNVIYEGIGIEPLNELKGSQTKADELKRIYNGVIVLEDEFFSLIEYYFKNFDKMYKILTTGKPSLKDITKIRDIGRKANDDIDEIRKRRKKRMEDLGFNMKTFWKDVEKKSKKFINVYGDVSVDVKKDMEKKLKERMDKCKPLWDRYLKYGTAREFGKILDKYEELGGDRSSISKLLSGWHDVIGDEIKASYNDLSYTLKYLKLDKYNSAFGKFLQKIKL